MISTLNNSVVVATCGRFHLFDQARELASRDLLYVLLTDYPRSYPGRFGIPIDKVRPLLTIGIIKYALARLPIPFHLRSYIQQAVHSAFSKRLPSLLPKEMMFFIGLSSFCLEALEACNERGISCAVDHGSFHQLAERTLILEEMKRFNISRISDLSSEWIIEKQCREFEIANHVFVLSKAAANSMIDNGVPSSKIFINNCGVNISSFFPGKKLDTTFRVIHVGAISIRKGIPDLLEGFRKANLVNAELCLIGGDIKSSGLQNLIHNYRNLNLKFHLPVAQSELVNYYQRSSVFVLMSICDGFGMVIPQAMACGLPIIVSENVGAKDLIEDGVNGFIIPIRSPELLAERLRQLKEDPSLARSMGEAAFRTVHHSYSWCHYGDRLADFLHKHMAAK